MQLHTNHTRYYSLGTSTNVVETHRSIYSFIYYMGQVIISGYVRVMEEKIMHMGLCGWLFERGLKLIKLAYDPAGPARF